MTTVAGAAVVVGVEAPAHSHGTVATAAGEAARRHRPLRIVHAVHWPRLPVVMPPGMTETVPEPVRERARSWLAGAAETAARVAPGVPVTTRLAAGRPAAVLTGESRHADLLVVGERGTGGLLVGSVALQVASHAACPVLVVRGEPRRTGPVVVGIDGSPHSAPALAAALQEASLRGAALVALHAWNGNDWTELNGRLPMTYEFWSGDAQEERVLAEALAGAGERYPDVPVRRQVVRGDPGSLLSEWSRCAQLVVVGDHRHGAVPGLVLGSVSRHLMFHAECPTAVVRGRSPVLTARGQPM
ncbi:universal stress protein [Couchioplanes caeruleus]|uniref:universal stress protein n=1 Tax=Couchioplanes caeruleus TaxID=56438 RepID=UPI0020BDDA14|nr:universal stress protein [Couchioplanes caeruleus]UQU61781.1 universal stress protein [Couchioplanes caeruleus]